MKNSKRYYSILDVISALRKAGKISSRKAAYLLFLAQNGMAGCVVPEIKGLYKINYDASGEGFYYIPA